MKEDGTAIMVREKVILQGKSISQVAREMEMSRTTVRKYLKGKDLQDKRIGSKRPSKLDPFKPKVIEYMDSGIYNAVVVFERLVEQGYQGGMSILKSFMSPLRPPQVTEGPAVRRYETTPGSQVQMDWGICKYLDIRGHVRHVACLVMILGYSRTRYIEFFSRCDGRSLLHGIVNAFLYFGGVPELLLTDHMKTVVDHTDNGAPKWNTSFKIFATDLGFAPKLCRVRRPQTKGKVERLVHYVKNNFMPGRAFTDIVDLNNQAKAWCQQVNNKVHSTTGETPMYLLGDEKLKSFPLDNRHLDYLWQFRKVSHDGFVSYEGAKYGVHWRFSGKPMYVTMKDNQVYIADLNKQVVQEHPRYRFGKKYIFAKGQYDGLKQAQGYARPPQFGRQIAHDDVQVRPLAIYASISEGI